MSKEKILKAELDKITDKVFAYGATEKKDKAVIEKKEKHKHKRQKKPSHLCD